jgi:hypothetical protein
MKKLTKTLIILMIFSLVLAACRRAPEEGAEPQATEVSVEEPEAEPTETEAAEEEVAEPTDTPAAEEEMEETLSMAQRT